jgi:hypothetical protein
MQAVGKEPESHVLTDDRRKRHGVGELTRAATAVPVLSNRCSFEPLMVKHPVSVAAIIWGLSPDGSQIGILREEGGANQIRFFRLQGGGTRTVAVNDYASGEPKDLMTDNDGASNSNGSSIKVRTGACETMPPSSPPLPWILTIIQ